MSVRSSSVLTDRDGDDVIAGKGSSFVKLDFLLIARFCCC